MLPPAEAPLPPKPAPTAPTGRLAPSPTGLLHIGHARSFLLAWWRARSRGGRLLLRIEDLDTTRVKPGMTEQCLLDLEWLGLDWDGPPAIQSADTAPYERALEQLEQCGLLYACVCSRREIRSALSAPHPRAHTVQAGGEDNGETRYPGTCRGRFDAPGDAERASGQSPGLRFRVRPGTLHLHDELRGDFTADVEAETGDFLLARRDGAYAYHLAVVVDDARFGVDEVVRGEDLLPSCGRQALLMEALDLPRPRWFHVPLVLDEHGHRLAKRDGALTLAGLRAEGVDPRALVAWVARSAGLDTPPRVHPRELLTGFSLARLPAEPPVFGPRQLRELRAAE